MRYKLSLREALYEPRGQGSVTRELRGYYIYILNGTRHHVVSVVSVTFSRG